MYPVCYSSLSLDDMVVGRNLCLNLSVLHFGNVTVLAKVLNSSGYDLTFLSAIPHIVSSANPNCYLSVCFSLSFLLMVS